MKKNTKKQPWIKPRHKVITTLAASILYPYVKFKYGIKIERFKEQGNRPYLVLYNHQTGFDQFFLGMAFRGAIYYVATEDIFSLGFLSTLLRFAVEPIPIKKQTTDIAAVKNCVKVSKEGGTIAIAPEGNRTYHGRTVCINPSIVSLIKVLKMPVAFFRIEGGFGVHPRWSDVIRKGKMRAYVADVLEPETIKTMSDDELVSYVQEKLYVDEAKADGHFYHAKNAEYMERVFYVCPYCGLSEFETHNDIITCKKCKKQIQYTSSKELKGIGFDFPFRFVADWYDYQCNYIHNLNPEDFISEPVYQDTVNFSEVIINKKKVLLKENAEITLYGNRIIVRGVYDSELIFNFADTTALAVLGKNKINIYHDKKVYQIRGSKQFNALKYVNFYYHYKNVNKGEKHGKFLGL